MMSFNETLWWILGTLGALLVLGYLGVEYLAWLERCQVQTLPGGLRFQWRGLQVDLQRQKQCLVVRTDRGHYLQHNTSDGTEQITKGALSARFDAYGLRLRVAPLMHAVTASGGGESTVPTHHCSVIFEHPATRSLLRIEPLPLRVGAEFGKFAAQATLWIEKLEARRAEEEQARAAQAAEAQASEGQASEQALTPDLLVARWRKAAGFSGSASDIGLDDKGGVAWFVDLHPDGRITLHADQRTVHTNLLGADIRQLGSELEVHVRDDFWSAGEPSLRCFRILKGRSPDERRAWQERLERLRNQLDAQAAPGAGG